VMGKGAFFLREEGVFVWEMETASYVLAGG
jgi:hypothetical protein